MLHQPDAAVLATYAPSRLSTSPTTTHSPSLPQPPATTEERTGLLMGLSAYAWWGLVIPLFFRLVRESPALEVTAWRTVAGLAMLMGVLGLTGRMEALRTALTTPRRLGMLSISSVLIAINWLTFVYAIESDRLMEASLGYFINPLVSVGLGVVFLGERLRTAQWIAVAIALTSVVWLTITQGSLPWISVVLAVSFGLYGLIRKRVDADAATGLTVECAILLLPALGVMWWHGLPGGVGADGQVGGAPWWLLLLGGPMTALPLIWFSAAARRLPLSTIGLLQYLAPTGQFLLSWLAFGEPLSSTRLIAFVAIWLALIIYTADAMHGHLKRGKAVIGPHGAIATEEPPGKQGQKPE